jgi:hypothetical protein
MAVYGPGCHPQNIIWTPMNYLLNNTTKVQFRLINTLCTWSLWKNLYHQLKTTINMEVSFK